MQTGTQAATGQTDTAPAAQQQAAGTGTAPAEGSQQQQMQQDQSAQTQQATQEQSQQQQATQEQSQQQATSETDKGKTEGDGKTAATAPEQYADFSIPDGYALGEIGDEFKSVAKELGLTQEQAQKLIDLDVKRANAQTEAVHRATAEWQAQSKADKEFGGDALEQNVGIAQKALNTFGTDALKTLLQQTGLANHPEVIRAFYRAGKAISEDRFVPSTGSVGAQDPANIMFPNQA